MNNWLNNLSNAMIENEEVIDKLLSRILTKTNRLSKEREYSLYFE